MEPFTKLTAIAAPLPMMNVDTDKIIPAKWLKTIQRTGLGGALFEAMRYLEDGSEHPEFVLNREPWRNAQILIAGDNFGCGSSREHAPWALLDFGIRCVIAPSFADIFYNNCFKNGILPIVLSKDEVDLLIHEAETRDRPHLHGRSGTASDPPADGQRADPVRRRSHPSAQAAARPRRHRPDAAARGADRRLRARAEGWLPLALSGGVAPGISSRTVPR